MNNINKNIIFISGGGTGGHLFPAITIGKRLEEMGREINTIGSKTDFIELSYLVVQLKDELEKIREQVQNIV